MRVELSACLGHCSSYFIIFSDSPKYKHDRARRALDWLHQTLVSRAYFIFGGMPIVPLITIAVTT